MGRSLFTISRELRRNVKAGGKGAGKGAGKVYEPFAAQQLAVARRRGPRMGRLVADPPLRAFVADRLQLRWSPEQICAALRVAFPDDPARQVVPETIYQAVYRPDLGGLARQFPRGCARAGGAAGSTGTRTHGGPGACSG